MNAFTREWSTVYLHFLLKSAVNIAGTEQFQLERYMIAERSDLAF